MDQAPPRAGQYRSGRERTPEASGCPMLSGPSSTAPVADRWRLSNGSLRAPFIIFLLLCFAGVLGLVYLSKLQLGLWEDGYFVIRFARNLWHHGSFSWNVADGPIYGMTSQTYQLLGTALYALAPEHLVLSLKAACTVALFMTVPVVAGALKAPTLPFFSQGSSASGVPDRAAGLMPLVVGLASAPILESTLTGLETVIGLLVVAASVSIIVRSTGTTGDRVLVTASVLAVYLTRPDAVLIPLLLLGGRWLLALRADIPSEVGKGASEAKALTWTLAASGAALLVLLGTFHLYYGTALPLPFYIKTHGITVQPADYIIHFAAEKAKNSAQAAFFAFPFVFIALHDRSRVVLLSLLAGAVFCGYHYLATIETMGYLARFYLPGLIAIFIAGSLAYRTYQLRRRWLVSGLVYGVYVAACIGLKRFEILPQALPMYVPALVATGVALLGPARYNPVSALVIGACLLSGAAHNYPVSSLSILADETILLRQIRRRPVFAGLEKLRAIEPKVVYHTDMGAPGVLFPEAKVVDLDGLLNEDITLRGARFEELCRADHPEAIFVPNKGYEQLRREVRSSECIKGYRAVTSMRHAPLHIRKDLVTRYRKQR